MGHNAGQLAACFQTFGGLHEEELREADFDTARKAVAGDRAATSVETELRNGAKHRALTAILAADLHQLQETQHHKGKHGSQSCDLPEPEPHRQTYGARQPHARSGG